MATTCFCGCDRNVPRFPPFIRSANNVGRDVTERLAWARAIFADDVAPDWIAEGDRHVAALRDAVHTSSGRALDNSAIQRWLKFGRRLEKRAVPRGAPPIRLWLDPFASNAAVGRWARESGLSADEAQREIRKRLEAGERMPWMSDVGDARNALRRTQEKEEE